MANSVQNTDFYHVDHAAKRGDDAAVQDAFDQGFTSVVLGSDLFILWKWAEQMRSIMEDHR